MYVSCMLGCGFVERFHHELRRVCVCVCDRLFANEAIGCMINWIGNMFEREIPRLTQLIERDDGSSVVTVVVRREEQRNRVIDLA